MSSTVDRMDKISTFAFAPAHFLVSLVILSLEVSCEQSEQARTVCSTLPFLWFHFLDKLIAEADTETVSPQILYRHTEDSEDEQSN